MAHKRKAVFVNCPFDGAYLPLFHAIVFAVIRCGFVPRCALEVLDSGGTRIAKIEKIIEECRLGIHDISRTELDETNNLPRFNMPLELGLFLGAKRYGDTIQKRKLCMILDREKYRYQKFMSDIAGQDIEAHGDKPAKLIAKVRDSLNITTKGVPLPSGAVVNADYTRFNSALSTICERLKIDHARLDYRDFAWIAADYVSVAKGE